MDKKKTTKKNYCYYIVLRYNYIKNGELGSKAARVTADELPTFGELEMAAKVNLELTHENAKYREGSAMMTFFQKITQKQAKRIFDNTVPKTTSFKTFD